MQTNTNNVNKTTGGKDKMNIVFCGIRNGHPNTNMYVAEIREAHAH